MKNKLVENLLDAFKSVMPIALVVLLVSYIIGIPKNTSLSFIISSVLLIIGIGLFTTGADISMIMIGESIGNSLVKKENKLLILLASLILGIVITISEPDLMVLANELPSIPSYLIIVLVALGVGIFLLIGVFRIFKKISYRGVVTFSLIVIMFLLFFCPEEFISLSFDAGGVTTGPMGVPLIVAFGYGITKIRSDKDAKSDTFGLCGLCSLGPVIVILILGLFFENDSYFSTDGFISNLPILEKFIRTFLKCLNDVALCLLPILCVFAISGVFGNKIFQVKTVKILFGLVITVLGLSLFLTGVSAGFMEMGYRIGSTISESDYKYLLIPLGMLLGYIIVNAEPAIKMLIKQVSDLTEGSISEKLINMCLSIGVCFAIGISLLRVFFGISMIYIIVPGYFIAGLLMYFSPKVFTTIAFDSGGAASGALTTSFLLPICIGACVSLNGNILMNAFGVGALVSLIPIITIESLGIIYDYKLKDKKNIKKFDEKIIDYVWEC